MPRRSGGWVAFAAPLLPPQPRDDPHNEHEPREQQQTERRVAFGQVPDFIALRVQTRPSQGVLAAFSAHKRRAG
jgi:hypothetical protein